MGSHFFVDTKAEEFGTADLNFAQKHLRILSGLYGVLRPLDLMQAYRLEMGRRFAVNGSKNLYEFWGSKITDVINSELADQTYKRKVLINLASNEYFNSVQPESLDAEIITPQFKDWSSGEYRVLSFFAKKARGEMAAFIMKNKQITPINKEKVMRESDFIVSKTDTKGRITYGNRIFIEFSGYSEKELLGTQHNVIRHPDMPRVVFKLLWDTLNQHKEIFA